jgi:autotransporter-associated beta strand protein
VAFLEPEWVSGGDADFVWIVDEFQWGRDGGGRDVAVSRCFRFDRPPPAPRLPAPPSAGAALENAGSLRAVAGAGVVALTNGGTLNFDGVGLRGAGSTIDFQPGSGLLKFGSLVLTHGLIGGYATIDGVDFAGTLSGGGTVAAAVYTPFALVGGSSSANYVLSGGTTTTGSVAANALKLSGDGSLVLGGPLSLSSGGLLFDNSSGAMTVGNGGSGSYTLGAAGAELIVMTNGSNSLNALTIQANLGGGAASLTKSGRGLLVIGGSNTYTGNTVINEGTLRLSSNSSRLGVPGASTLAVIRQEGWLDVAGKGANTLLYPGGPSLPFVNLGVLQGAGRLDNGVGTASAVGLGRGGASTASGVFSGVISNLGGGSLTLVRDGVSGTQTLTGLNTYTGATVLSGGGSLAVNLLADGGVASSIGASTSDASNLVFNGGVLQYVGSNSSFTQFTQTPSVSTDRLFTLAGNGTLDSSGQYGSGILGTNNPNHAALVFSNPGAVAYSGIGPRVLTLRGPRGTTS